MHWHALVYSQVQKDTEHSSIFLENYTHSKSHLCCSGGGKARLLEQHSWCRLTLELVFPPSNFLPQGKMGFFFSQHTS